MLKKWLFDLSFLYQDRFQIILLNIKMTKYLIFFLLISNPAYAYLDPGTGSLILYFIMGLFATVIFYFKWIIYKIREFLIGNSSKIKIKNSDKIDILFYSEGGQYWNVFKPIIEELEKKKLKVSITLTKKMTQQ